ncbi:MAG: ABC transporter permease [Candidatus Promineifilaceae bacterium]
MAYSLKWFNSYRLMLHWQALRAKPLFPFFVVMYIFTGVGMVIGLSYMYPEIDEASAMFLATGGSTMTLIVLGLILVPQVVAQTKAQGNYEYIYSLPVPRMAFLAADLTIWLLAVLPGLIMALFYGAWRFEFELQFNPLIGPAFLMVVLTATGIGYAIAHLAPKAELVNVITNFIIFCLFLFSPINYPVERLPDWLGSVHQVLPVMHAADVIRGTLMDSNETNLALNFAVLGAWCIAGFVITFMAMTRRR